MRDCVVEADHRRPQSLCRNQHRIVASTERVGTRIVALFRPFDACGGSAFPSGQARHVVDHGNAHSGRLKLPNPIDYRVGRYLRIPSDQPAYRAGRSHEDFLCNLPLERDELKQHIARAWSAVAADVVLPIDAMRDLVRTKYAADEWNLRR